MNLIFQKDYKFQISVLLVTFSLLVLVVGVLYYRHEKGIVISSSYDDLNAIANLKQTQIEQWHMERLSEAVFFSTNEPLVQDIVGLASGAKGNYMSVRKPLQHMLSHNRYENIFLVDTSGNLIFSLDSTFNVVDSITLQFAFDALKRHAIVLSDFYLCPYHKTIHFDIVAPVKNEQKDVVALLYFRVNPNDYLYPLIKTWPTPSTTAETIKIGRALV